MTAEVAQATLCARVLRLLAAAEGSSEASVCEVRVGAASVAVPLAPAAAGSAAPGGPAAALPSVCCEPRESARAASAAAAAAASALYFFDAL